MKKLIKLMAIVATLCMVLVGCSSAPSLEGNYNAQGFLMETMYTFDKDFNVNASIYAGGYEVFNCDGTYSINEDETEITLSFESTSDSNGKNLLNGTYTFTKGEGFIQIGKQKLNKMSE